MNALDTEPDHEAQITDTLDNNGILANIDDIQTKLRDAHGRLRANKVGTIELRPQEVYQLRKEGSRWVKDLARILGVETRNGGIFGNAFVEGFASHGGLTSGGNYIGK